MKHYLFFLNKTVCAPESSANPTAPSSDLALLFAIGKSSKESDWAR